MLTYFTNDKNGGTVLRYFQDIFYTGLFIFFFFFFFFFFQMKCSQTRRPFSRKSLNTVLIGTKYVLRTKDS